MFTFEFRTKEMRKIYFRGKASWLLIPVGKGNIRKLKKRVKENDRRNYKRERQRIRGKLATATMKIPINMETMKLILYGKLATILEESQS